jgi:phage shock protein B
MSAMRVLSTMVAICLGFALMMGTVAGFAYIAAEAMNIRGPEIVVVYGIVLLVFLGFLRFASGFLSGLTQGVERETRKATDINEVQLMQDLHQGMSRMEQRVETLETLLLDRHHASAARPPGLRL